MPSAGTAIQSEKTPAKREVPKGLKPFTFHGIRFSNIDSVCSPNGSDQGIADCPFCGAEKRFFVNRESTLFDCKVCGVSGNSMTFIRKLWEAGEEFTTDEDYDRFRKERNLLHAETLKRWGIRMSHVSNKWILPGFGPDGKMNQLYKYSLDSSINKMRWFATPDMNHHLCGPLTALMPNQPVDETLMNKGVVYVSEGVGDGMILWELLQHTKWNDDHKPVFTTNPQISLLSDATVVSVPGANVFYESWANMFGSKKVILLYDNDHHRMNKQTKQKIIPASYAGMKRATEIMTKAEEQPAEIHYLKWTTNPDANELDPATLYDTTLKHGYDLKDLLTNEGSAACSKMTARIEQFKILLDRIKPVPDEWIAGKSSTANVGSTKMELTPCSSWKDLTMSCRKSMKWTEGLDRALSVMLAVITSTKANGDQLWCKIIGPPSCGKSTLCEMLSTNKDYILAKSTIRGFHSGYKTDKDGDEDHSLITLVKDKTLVTKDGDTLLQSPNFKQILSEARDVYDKVSRTHYRHALSRDYEGINMTWILCGTSSLREIDESELGARFIDCVIMEGIDDDLEDEILWRVVNRAERIMSHESNGSAESHNDPDMTATMQLCGGYINYIRQNAQNLLNAVVMDDDAKRKCLKLGKFVAFMRARPSKRQGEVAEREFGSRLASQFTRLAKCLAVVLNRESVDEEVMRRVQHCAMDTSRGRVLEAIKYIHSKGSSGAVAKSIALVTHETDKEIRELLRFMAKIHAIESWQPSVGGVTHTVRWKLTERMSKLYSLVMEEQTK